jgi:hypothetical protein
MKRTAYGQPLFLGSEGAVTMLTKFQATDELTIQNLIFEHPECLPISDIDESYNPIIPVCTELNTTVGPLDILMISPNGELAIIETKLWRNPEARRVVVAQILDYAKELSNWTYEDLQREVNRRLGRKGNTLYEIVKAANPDLLLPESDFVDSVSRNLSRGRFLLLIAGDGIREGAIGIAEFLSSAAHLNFTFAMVELSVFEAKGLGKLIIPKTIVRTTEIAKMTIEIPSGMKLSISEQADVSTLPAKLSEEKERESSFYRDFWKEFVSELEFDDPGQSMPNPANAQNLYIYLGGQKKAWVSAYFSKSSKRVGVYFRVARNQGGLEIKSRLEEDIEGIREELGNEVIWDWDDFASIGVRKHVDDVFDTRNREEIKNFFKVWMNNFVNALRPRLKSQGV